MNGKLWIGLSVLVVFSAVVGYILISGDIFQSEETFPATDVVREFKMTAKRFEFEPARIEVDAGDTVILKITGLDDGRGGGHGFAIKKFHIDEVIGKGKTVTIQFVADKKGTFTFFCSVDCGVGHRNMIGTLVVS